MNIDKKAAKGRLSIIVSSYRNGSPIGPMFTAKLYTKALCEANDISVLEVLVVCEKDSNIEKVSMEYSFAKNLTIVEAEKKMPILLRSVFDVGIRSAIRGLYKKSDLVVAIWYPGIILNLTPTMLKKSIVVMMDSQASLILSTLSSFEILYKVGNLFKLFVYTILEIYIGIYSRVIAYVSENDLKLIPSRYAAKIIYPKLPIEKPLDMHQHTGTLTPNILIPRPDPELLGEFIEKLSPMISSKIFVLLNAQLDSKISERVTHIKYVNNYLDFYSAGGLVVLLDRGGAGVTNRVLAVSSLGLPFIGTTSALRGHNFKFPNCLLISDNMLMLSKKAEEVLDFLQVEKSEDLKNYVKSHSYENAILPIKNSIIKLS